MDEMEVVYDGLVSIIGEPGSDDEVASSYDCGVQNDVGTGSMRKKREAVDGFHCRQRRKMQKTHHPANTSSSSRPREAAYKDARELIVDRMEERGERRGRNGRRKERA